jgi:hypothetical protein
MKLVSPFIDNSPFWSKSSDFAVAFLNGFRKILAEYSLRGFRHERNHLLSNK